jgi:hypothetical protein
MTFAGILLMVASLLTLRVRQAVTTSISHG